MRYALSALVVAVALALRAYVHAPRWSPDGNRYAAMARSTPQPRPFAFRWLMPRLLGPTMLPWRIASALGMVASAALVSTLTGSPWAGALLACSPLVRLACELPVLTDSVAMALGLWSAVAATRQQWALSCALAALAGACRESAPIWASVWSGSPLPLLGLVTVKWWAKVGPRDGDVYCGRPLKEVAARIWRERRHDPLSWSHAMGWGPVLPLAAFGASWDRPTALACIALALAYAQLAIATDKARLYLWAMPALLPLAVRAVDARWLCVACVVYALVPYREV